jgi:hypothetical protein
MSGTVVAVTGMVVADTGMAVVGAGAGLPSVRFSVACSRPLIMAATMVVPITATTTGRMGTAIATSRVVGCSDTATAFCGVSASAIDVQRRSVTFGHGAC